MRLNAKPRPVRWTDRTLSILRASRLEACEKELAGLGGRGLFDEETTDADAERLFEESYYAEEEKAPRLHTIEEMRVRVLSQLPAETGLLSQEEFELAVKMALFGGEMPVLDWNDLPCALSLVRRMWCRARPERGNWIRMPRQVCAALLLMLASEEIKTVRETVQEILDTVDNTLYLAGMMPAEVAVRDMAFRLQGSLAAGKQDLFLRLLKSSFETMLNREGKLMLVHPGLADPMSLTPADHAGTGMDQRSLTDLYESLMEVEDPLYDRMLGLIKDLGRPEMQAEDTVEDLILLAKQGAPAEEMRQVLAARIICMPTAEMEAALQALHDRIPKWFTLNMERVQ